MVELVETLRQQVLRTCFWSMLVKEGATEEIAGSNPASFEGEENVHDEDHVSDDQEVY